MTRDVGTTAERLARAMVARGLVAPECRREFEDQVAFYLRVGARAYARKLGTLLTMGSGRPARFR